MMTTKQKTPPITVLPAIGVIGLGRMGQAIVARLLAGGYNVLGYDKYPVDDLNLTIDTDSTSTNNIISSCLQSGQPGSFMLVSELRELVQATDILWLMVPSGKPVDELLDQIREFGRKEITIIDGGNSFFRDSIRRYEQLQKQNIKYLDCGTSGGLHGRNQGFSLMIGGDKAVFERIEPIFKLLAAPEGYGYMGPAGAGHYVKMIHNGIEYALLEGYAEGFNLLKEGYYPDLDLAKISNVWLHGSIIRSWLLELAHTVFERDQTLKTIYGAIGESGTGKWTVDEAHRAQVPVPVIECALQVRAESRKTGGNYATKVVALLRQAFGGHPVTYVFYDKDGQKQENK